MLKDQDRIFKNLYNDLGSDITSSQKRGDWVNTKELTSKEEIGSLMKLKTHNSEEGVEQVFQLEINYT